MALSKIELNEVLNQFFRKTKEYRDDLLNSDCIEDLGDVAECERLRKRADKTFEEIKVLAEKFLDSKAKDNRLKRAKKWCKDHNITLD